MMNDFKLKRCVVNEGEFEFEYTRFGELSNDGAFGEKFQNYNVLLIIDTDLSESIRHNYMDKMFTLMDKKITSLTFYDFDDTVITTITGYDHLIDIHTDLINYGEMTNYRGSVRFGRIINKQ